MSSSNDGGREGSEEGVGPLQYHKVAPTIWQFLSCYGNVVFSDSSFLYKPFIYLLETHLNDCNRGKFLDCFLNITFFFNLKGEQNAYIYIVVSNIRRAMRT